MKNIDFKEFELKVSDILPILSKDELALVEDRILAEIQNRHKDPDTFEDLKSTREKILEIEHKVLSKLENKKYKPLKKEGKQCSICSGYESDVELLFSLGKEYHVCSKCVLLIKEIIDEKDE